MNTGHDQAAATASWTPDPAVLAQAGPFERALAQWVHERSADPALAAAALALAVAQGLGHACLLLDEDGRPWQLSGAAALDRAALAASPWVSTSAELARPYVLEAASGRFYSWRHHGAELRVAAQLRARLGQPAAASMELALAAAELLPLPAPGQPDPAASQRAALAQAPGRALFVLSGGPGTGKTSTVLRLLLLEQACNPGQPLRIRLAAPTGKAAQRLAEAVRAGKAALAGQLQQAPPASPLLQDWQAQLAAVPESAETLHGLLGFQPHSDRFRHQASEPLGVDLVVVDEASMVDLGLLDALLDALPGPARLVLVGDPDQLTSVAAGSVLADWMHAASRSAELRAHTAVLDHVWRAEGALVRLARGLRGGQPEAVQAELANPAATDLRWRQLQTPTQLNAALGHWLARHGVHYTSLRTPGLAPAAALERLRRLQVLCAVRDGAFGVVALNVAIDRWLRGQSKPADSGTWYPGRIVMLTRNQHALRLYNGDLGIALEGEDGLQVWFEGSDEQGKRSARALQPRQLPEHEDAFAITVHKSQGSEYDEVLLVLPPDPSNRVLSRQLLYTGATRPKRTLELWAAEPSLLQALLQPVQRMGGLADRLAGEAVE